MPIIYLSPSLQPYNEYLGGGNEQYYMNRLADAMVPYLRASGIRYVRNIPGTSVGQAIMESNSDYYDLHLALHSNTSPEELAGRLRGTDVYYYINSKLGQRAANIIADNFKKIYPIPSLVKTMPTSDLVEVVKTNAPAVLVETAYHDNVDDVEWIKSNINSMAANLVQSLTQYFGIPFISNPQPARQATVTTQGGNLNIRARPNLNAEVITQAPNKAPITILGEWQGWYVVDYKGNVGYASSSYITK